MCYQQFTVSLVVDRVLSCFLWDGETTLTPTDHTEPSSPEETPVAVGEEEKRREEEA